jgi:hypothetical protein
MCSYGSFAKYAKPPQRDPNAVEKPRGLSAYERRFGVSVHPSDVAFVEAAKNGLSDTVGDFFQREGDEKPSSVDVVCRVGGRAQTNKLVRTRSPIAANDNVSAT